MALDARLHCWATQQCDRWIFVEWTTVVVVGSPVIIATSPCLRHPYFDQTVFCRGTWLRTVLLCSIVIRAYDTLYLQTITQGCMWYKVRLVFFFTLSATSWV